MAGDRTRIDCLEGNHADHYTTIAILYQKRESIYTIELRKTISNFKEKVIISRLIVNLIKFDRIHLIFCRNIYIFWQ